MYPDDYRFLQEHDAPFAYRETEQETTSARKNSEEEMLPVVSRASDIREEIQRMVSSGEESATFLLKNYVGNVDQDMKNMYNDLLNDSPKYIYAMDDPFYWSLSEIDAGQVVRIRMKLRLTPQEVQNIPTLMFAPAMNEVYSALLQQSSTYTVQISGYEDQDLYTLLDAYILRHPDQIVEAPDISVSVFPNRGSVRIVELHFFYNTDRETLSERKKKVNAVLEGVKAVLEGGNNQNAENRAEELVEILSQQLVSPIAYQDDPDATVYTQIVQRRGSNSRIMASVVAYLCNKVGAECEIVVGKRGEEIWYWNRIMTNTGWQYFDLHLSALNREVPVLLPYAQLIGYYLDPEQYPEIHEPEEQTVPTDPETTTEDNESADPTAFTGPTESSSSEEETNPDAPSETEEAEGTSQPGEETGPVANP